MRNAIVHQDRTKYFDIGFVVDETYSYYLPQLIAEIISQKEDFAFHFHILCVGMRGGERTLRAILKKMGAGFTIYSYTLDYYEKEFQINQIDVPTRYRYTLAKFLLFQNVKCRSRILYLDVDIRVRATLAEIRSLKTSKIIAAVPDSGMRRLLRRGDHTWKQYLQDIGIKKQNEYFNSGVIIVNIEKWRRFNCYNELKKILSTTVREWKFGDQCILNYYFSGNWEPILPKFNMQLTLHKNFTFTNNKIKRIAKCTILHFCGSPKPWERRSFVKSISRATPEKFTSRSILRTLLKDGAVQWRQHSKRRATNEERFNGSSRYKIKRYVFRSPNAEVYDWEKCQFVIIIGSMRAGTTSLFHFMNSFSTICGAVTKEPEYFSSFQEHGVRSKDYRHLFCFDSNNQKILLEASTGYSKFPIECEIPERIFREVPSAKFIFIARDPLVRALSHLKHHKARYGSWARVNVEECFFISNYQLQLQQYTRWFDESQFMVLEFSELCAKPKGVLTKVFDWLQIPAEETLESFPTLNQGVGHMAPDEETAIRQFFVSHNEALRQDITSFCKKWKIDIRNWGEYNRFMERIDKI